MGVIVIKEGDITKEKTQAIVNAANESLRGGGGVDGAIHRAAGDTLLQECIAIGGCKTGEAVLTGAGNLGVQYVIHTVGPVWRGGTGNEAGLLRACYRNSFALARAQRIKSIAFPAISTGVYHYPVPEAARIALEEGKKVIDAFDTICYVCFGKDIFDTYQNIYNAT